MKRRSRTSGGPTVSASRNHAKTVPFDVVDFLRTDEEIAAWISVNLEEGSIDEILHALFDACRARGMGKVARSAGLGREGLYKALAPGAHPRFETILKLLRGFGLVLAVKPAPSAPRPARRRAGRTCRRGRGTSRPGSAGR